MPTSILEKIDKEREKRANMLKRVAEGKKARKPIEQLDKTVQRAVQDILNRRNELEKETLTQKFVKQAIAEGVGKDVIASITPVIEKMNQGSLSKVDLVSADFKKVLSDAVLEALIEGWNKLDDALYKEFGS